MLTMEKTAPTMLFRLPADHAPYPDRRRNADGNNSYRMANTLYVTYDDFLEAVGISPTRPLAE